jgi:4a-hydroxytetrahydrobiopterin dehydratase
MANHKMSEAEIREELAKLPEWSLEGEKLQRTFRFADFVAAFGFMARCALVAERMNHHPEWYNVYGLVRVDLTTHDCGGISQRDFTLARHMNRLAASELA